MDESDNFTKNAAFDGERFEDGFGSDARADPSGDEDGCEAARSLTRNESLVHEVLKDAESPMKAYEILETLKPSGVRAPMTVYRALEGLESKGVVHKLEAMNAFVVCNHDGPHKVQAFLVCETCPTVSEVDVHGLESLAVPMVREAGFSMEVARLEIRGRCGACRAA